VQPTSVTAYKGNVELIDYSATKGAIVSFTRSLSQALVEKKILVNAVAPGPIWTPLIPASVDENKMAQHGAKVPMTHRLRPVARSLHPVRRSQVYDAGNDRTHRNPISFAGGTHRDHKRLALPEHRDAGRARGAILSALKAGGEHHVHRDMGNRPETWAAIASARPPSTAAASGASPYGDGFSAKFDNVTPA
jgi:short chain dehydrogenase